MKLQKKETRFIIDELSESSDSLSISNSSDSDESIGVVRPKKFEKSPYNPKSCAPKLNPQAIR